MRELTNKQKRFVEEYLVDLNATQAAIRSGYKHPDNGRQLLTKTHVRVAVEDAQKKRAQRLEVSQDWVLSTLVENVERAMQAIEVLDRDGNCTGEYRYEGNVANRALELVGKHLGMFTERYEHSFSSEAEIIVGGYVPSKANETNGTAAVPSSATNGSQ